MRVDIYGGTSDRAERTQQIKSLHSAEPEDHLVARYDDECLHITYIFIIITINIILIISSISV